MILFLAMLASSGVHSWKSTATGTVEYNHYDRNYYYYYYYPITDCIQPTPAPPKGTIHPTPVKQPIRNDKLKRFLLKRGLDWMVDVMP